MIDLSSSTPRRSSTGAKQLVVLASVVVFTLTLAWMSMGGGGDRGSDTDTLISSSRPPAPTTEQPCIRSRPSRTGECKDSSGGPASTTASTTDVVVFTPVPGTRRTAKQLLPWSVAGLQETLSFDYRAGWDENGDRGWRRKTRREGETRASCPSLVRAVEAEYAAGSARYHGYKVSASYKMPWYYHDDPAPVCGQVLLRHYQGGPKHVYVLRLATTAAASISAEEWTSLATVPATRADTQLDPLLAGAAEAKETVFAMLGKLNTDVTIADCGECGDASSPGCDAHANVLITARLVGYNGFMPATVTRNKNEAGKTRYTVAFTPTMPGQYALEVKVVHLNGTSDDPRHPKSLGVIGIRAMEGNRKAFKYNALCDEQRHVFGSPLRVVVLLREGRDDALSPGKQVQIPTMIPPFCTTANHTNGKWIRFTPTTCAGRNSPFCFGNPTWLTDAAAWNTDYLWAPDGCRYVYFDPPNGPPATCLTVPNSPRAFLLLVGDSVAREYTKNCLQFNLANAQLQCLFANIALEGQHYSTEYAASVARVVVENIITNNAGVFVTNLGIHHMIGPCTTAQWTEFVTLFVDAWNSAVVWHPRAHGGRAVASTAAGRAFQKASAGADGKFTLTTQGKYPTSATVPRLERAIWMGPPTIHYARKGMGAQRAQLWDEIAWKHLEPLGFERLRAIPVTATRQEGTWDGLHYASERNKLQTRWRNKAVAPKQWNGGVANMLFTMLLNLICYGGGGENA